MKTLTVSQIARVAHELNRSYCRELGDNSIVGWDDTTDDIKASTIAGVRNVLHNPAITPEDSHHAWHDYKSKQGWVYGPEKDANKKEHPCMMPFQHLPAEQRVKDVIFIGLVRALRNLAEFA